MGARKEADSRLDPVGTAVASGPASISGRDGLSRLSKPHEGRIEACRQLRDEEFEVGDLRAVEFMHERMIGREIELWLLEKFGG